MKKLIIAVVVILAIVSGVMVAQAEPVCSDGGGWTKIDSNDLSLYPVDGAVEYCFKAGSSNSKGCVGGIFNEWPPEVDN